MSDQPIRAVLVLSFDLPGSEAAAEIIRHVDPQNIPHFAGEARLAINEDAAHVLNYLDGIED